jgi:hypothetical protein
MPSGLFSRIFGVDNANPITSTNPLPVATGGSALTGASITSVTGTVPAASTQISFTAPSGNFIIQIGGTTPAITYLSFVSPATTSSFAINPITATAGSYTYSGAPVSSIYIIGASAAGTYSVLAH